MDPITVVAPVTREELDEVLAFPREYMRRGLPPVWACHHAQNFDVEDSRCLFCEHRDGCEWLWQNDECGPIGSKSETEVAEALKRALTQVEVNTARHYDCTCFACRWRGRTRDVLERLSVAGLAEG